MRSRPAFVDAAAWKIRNRLKRVPWIRRLAGKEPLPRGLRRQREGAVPVQPGRWIVTDESADLPVVLFVLVGLDHDETSRWVDEVAGRQVETQAFVPVFVVDTAPFDRLRHHDFAFEFVPPRDDWQGTTLREEWFDFLSRRIEELRRLYRPDAVVPVGAGASEAGLWAVVASAGIREGSPR